MSEIKAEWTNKDNLGTETTASDYIKREDAHVAMDIAFNNRLNEYAHKEIDRMPAADVEPVVRCKDCRYKETCCRNIFTSPTDYEAELEYCSMGAKMDGDKE